VLGSGAEAIGGASCGGGGGGGAFAAADATGAHALASGGDGLDAAGAVDGPGRVCGAAPAVEVGLAAEAASFVGRSA
jgi:hypothetical protein